MRFTDWEELLDWLVAARKEKGLSMTDVGKAIGRPSSTIHRIETKKRVPLFPLLLEYARGVGFEVAAHIDDGAPVRDPDGINLPVTPSQIAELLQGATVMVPVPDAADPLGPPVVMVMLRFKRT